MSSSTRSQQASTEQMSIGDKLSIFSNLLISYAAAMVAAFTGFSQGADQKPSSMYRHFMYAATQKITDSMSVAQLQFILPPTDVTYMQLCKRHGLNPKSEVLTDGTQAHWIGPSTAEKIIVNFHGGGFVLPSGWAYMEFMYQLQQFLSKEGKDVAVLFLSYDLAPTAKYPRQLQQAAALLSHVLYTLQKLPANIILTGDSAGGNLALALLSHILHPHPSRSTPITPVHLASPLRGLVLTSPWVSFSGTKPSYTTNARKDLITASTGQKWSRAFMGTPPPHEANADEYNQAIMAAPEWWEGLPVQEVLILCGKEEIMVDDVVDFAEKLKAGMGMRMKDGTEGEPKLTVLAAERECHDQTNLDLQFGFKEPGQQAKLFRSWVASRL